MTNSLSGFDFEAYSKAVAYISRLSRLYSTTDHAYIVYRFAEKLFCATTGAEDLAAKDISFDARLGSGGFGIKTFVASSDSTVKREKVAEFTKFASAGTFVNLPNEELVKRVSELRNARVQSDAAEIGVDMSVSIYHCLVRFPGFAKVFEEPYELIDVQNIVPLAMNGTEVQAFAKNGGTVYFGDGKHRYQFLTAKNTLVKSFDLNSAFLSKKIETPIFEEIWDEVLGSVSLTEGALDASVGGGEIDETEAPTDFVVLPLYSTQRKDLKEVPLKSGINQWNAGGRVRSFGEAYIPVPMAVHKTNPGFFPPRDTKFSLFLPNGDVVEAKLCQDNSKALMSDPNDRLCRWLFSMIDGNWDTASRRLQDGSPYTYDDLLEIDKDSVKVRRDNATGNYYLESARVGDYEKYTRDAAEG